MGGTLIEKKCTGCLITKPISDFNKNSQAKDGYYHKCKECRYGHVPHKKNLENNKVCTTCSIDKPIGEYSWVNKVKGWKQSECNSCKNKKKSIKGYDHAKNRERLLYKYGITVEEYNRMFELQDKKCSICNKPSIKKLHVDHCHTTNEIRGLLCSNCNTMLGHAKDNIDILKAGIEYLIKSIAE